MDKTSGESEALAVGELRSLVDSLSRVQVIGEVVVEPGNGQGDDEDYHPSDAKEHKLAMGHRSAPSPASPQMQVHRVGEDQPVGDYEYASDDDGVRHP